MALALVWLCMIRSGWLAVTGIGLWIALWIAIVPLFATVTFWVLWAADMLPVPMLAAAIATIALCASQLWVTTRAQTAVKDG